MHVVIWDLDDTLYPRHLQVGDDYSGLEDVILFPDAIPALSHEDQIDILVTKESRRGVQDTKIDALGIREFFEEIYIVTSNEAKRKVFSDIQDTYPMPIYVVGDRINAEIRIANELGMATVLCPRGKYLLLKPKDSYEKPDYTIRNLTELRGIIESDG